MSVIRTENAVANQPAREFIGKAWINTVKQGKHEGTQFISVKLDRNISKVDISAGQGITLWPNVKREGKQDADYRVSIK